MCIDIKYSISITQIFNKILNLFSFKMINFKEISFSIGGVQLFEVQLSAPKIRNAAGVTP